MKFTESKLPGVYILEMEPFQDQRGSFARQFCRRELAEHGLDFDIKQCNLSANYKAGTLRGLHYQQLPYPETKIVSCLQGAIFDVVVDLRPDSPTYLQHICTELSAQNGRMLYIAPLCAHGFQTLQDHSLVYYQLGEFFYPQAYTGVRWNDPKLNIRWPDCEQRIINERDSQYELL